MYQYIEYNKNCIINNNNLYRSLKHGVNNVRHLTCMTAKRDI